MGSDIGNIIIIGLYFFEDDDGDPLTVNYSQPYVELVNDDLQPAL